MDEISENRPQVLLLGHSFMRRLYYDLIDNVLPADFGLAQCVVDCFGLGGYRLCKRDNDATKHAFWQSFGDKINSLQPKIVVLQVGENDVDSSVPALNVASAIEEVAAWLNNSVNIPLVMVCELFPRENTRISPMEYEEKRKLTNTILETMVSVHGGVRFWKHRRIFQAQTDIFASDGIHLSPFGQQRYHRSLRYAIMMAVRRVNSNS